MWSQMPMRMASGPSPPPPFASPPLPQYSNPPQRIPSMGGTKPLPAMPPQDEEDLARAIVASEKEQQAMQAQSQQEQEAMRRIMEESARDAARADEAQEQLDRIAEESHMIEEERRARVEEEERQALKRAMKASAKEAEVSQADTDAAEAEMLELALALSINLATADADQRRDWAPSVGDEEAEREDEVMSEAVMEEGPLRVLGPRGLSLLWKDGRSHTGGYAGSIPLTTMAQPHPARRLPSPPPSPSQLVERPVAQTRTSSDFMRKTGYAPRAGSASPDLVSSRRSSSSPKPIASAAASIAHQAIRKSPSSSRQSSYTSKGHTGPLAPKASPPRQPAYHSSTVPLPPPKPARLSSGTSLRAPTLASRSSAPAAVSSPPAPVPLPSTSGRTSAALLPSSLPTLSTLPIQGPNPLSSLARTPSSAASTARGEDPFSDEHEARNAESSPASEANDTVTDLWAATHRTRPLHRHASSPTLSHPPSNLSETAPSITLTADRARRSSQPTVPRQTRSPAPMRAQSERRPVARPEERETTSQMPSGEIERRVSWGFVGGELVTGVGLPDVVQLSNAAGEGKYASFVVQAPTWRALLRMLMWYGSTRLEVSPRDFVDRKSSAPFESAIVLDFFPNALALTFHLLPSKRGYVPRASASPGRRTLPLPSSPLPLPTVLANIATLLHASLLTARTCNTGPLQSLPGEVEMLARAAGEPITEGLEAERGLVDRLKKRLKRHHERRETMLGEEEVPDGALLIQPFRLEEFG